MDKLLVREIHSEKLGGERPISRNGDPKPAPTPSLPSTSSGKGPDSGKGHVTLRNGDQLGQVPEKKVDDLRSQYRRNWPHLEFAPVALERLLGLDMKERAGFESKFGRLNLGHAPSEHNVPRTAPVIWELYVLPKEGRIYYRQIASQTYTVELIGGKGASQDRDYRKLQKRFRPKS